MVLKRYTDLSSLLVMLESKKITLFDPRYWDDTNDAYYIQLYKERKNLASVLALCFTEASETYHHWKVFSHGSSGVCIEFDKEKLLSFIKKTIPKNRIRARRVKYLKLKDARNKVLKLDELPFIKRIGYKPEQEFRIIYENPTETSDSLKIDIDLNIVRCISLSPWLHNDLRTSTKIAIDNAAGRALTISKSGLTSNCEWKKIGQRAI